MDFITLCKIFSGRMNSSCICIGICANPRLNKEIPVKSKMILMLAVLSINLSVANSVLAEDAPAPASTPPAAESYQAAAEKSKGNHFTLTKGGFVQGGALLGFAMDPLEAISAGLTTALGYQINPYVGIYARSDLFGILDDSATHLSFTFIPSARFTIFDNLYGFGGVGYALTYAPANSTITGAAAPISRSYHSFTTEAGLGYVFLFNKGFGLFGEGGLNYTYISKASFVQTEMWRPFGRFGVSVQF